MQLAVIEQWEARGHYERYLGWRTETGVLDSLVAMMDGEPLFPFFDYFGVQRRALLLSRPKKLSV